jgi:PIN domain nuclease of toxin-antitoxin system
MPAVVADTHTTVWYLLEPQKLSQNAMAALEAAEAAGDPIYLSAISLVEVIYLIEKGKLPEVALTRLHRALTDPTTAFVIAPVDVAIAQALQQIPRDRVPDMPDRIIAATALHLRLPLVSRGREIRAAQITTIW